MKKMCRGLYIHIPFCIRKCKYCDFISYCGKEEYFDKYIDSLLEEAREVEGSTVDTVFIGGGTPTVMSCGQLKKLISGITDIFDIKKNAEYSIEANPKTLSYDKLEILKNGGINRLSIGVQSFNDSELSAIGRIHNAQSVYNTIKEVKESGIDNFNLDLMLNLPNQTMDSLKNTLETAVSLNPTHLSCYSLILEENTPLEKEYRNGKYKEPDDDFDRELYHYTVNYLKKNGYNRYEISNFAKKGKECRHNIKYWNCDEYIGLGVAAHSYIDGIRSYNVQNLEEYLKGNYHSDDKAVLTENDKISEYMIMKLRMSEGIGEDEFYKRFKMSIKSRFSEQLERFIRLGLMNYEKGDYFLTDYGIDVSNSVLCEFV